MHAPFSTGLASPMAGVLLAVVAFLRMRTAWLSNHRYRFTTWRIGRVFISLLLIGFALKLALWWR
jgi:uncharacterized membrane protein